MKIMNVSPRFKTKLWRASSFLWLAVAAIATLCLASGETFAAVSSAAASDTDQGGLAEIVVTVNKIEEASSRVGATIQTIDVAGLLRPLDRVSAP